MSILVAAISLLLDVWLTSVRMGDGPFSSSRLSNFHHEQGR